MSSQIVKYLVGLITALLIIGGTYVAHRIALNHAVTKEHNAVVTVYEKQVAEQKALVAAANAQLAFQKTQADLEKQSEIKSIDDKHDALVSSLQNRITRSSTGVNSTGHIAAIGKACTGAGLYRDDAEFLAGFASSAAKVAVERDYYYGRYEDARVAGQKLDGGLNGKVSNSVPVSGN